MLYFICGQPNFGKTPQKQIHGSSLTSYRQFYPRVDLQLISHQHLHLHLIFQYGVVRLRDVAQYMLECGLGDLKNQNPKNSSEVKSWRKRNQTFHTAN